MYSNDEKDVEDELYEEAVQLVVEMQSASVIDVTTKISDRV